MNKIKLDELTKEQMEMKRHTEFFALNIRLRRAGICLQQIETVISLWKNLKEDNPQPADCTAFLKQIEMELQCYDELRNTDFRRGLEYHRWLATGIMMKGE